jgi:hypothetical protein
MGKRHDDYTTSYAVRRSGASISLLVADFRLSRRVAARVQSRAKSRKALRSSSVEASAAQRTHSFAYCLY